MKISKKQLWWGIGGLVIIVAIVTTIIILTHPKPKTPTPSSEQPTYQVIKPSGIKVVWQKISPTNSSPVYAYVDGIDGVEVDVSEQPLPASFQSDPSGKVAQLAQSYNATDVVTAGTTKVYIGTNANGPQSVIFTKSNLLVLIKSQAQLSDSTWASYITSLN